MRLQLGVQVIEDETGLDRCRPTLDVDVEHAAKVLGVVDDQGGADRLAALTGSGAARQHRHLQLARNVDRRGDVLARSSALARRPAGSGRSRHRSRSALSMPRRTGRRPASRREAAGRAPRPRRWGAARFPRPGPGRSRDRFAWRGVCRVGGSWGGAPALTGKARAIELPRRASARGPCRVCCRCSASIARHATLPSPQGLAPAFAERDVSSNLCDDLPEYRPLCN